MRIWDATNGEMLRTFQAFIATGNGVLPPPITFQKPPAKVERGAAGARAPDATTGKEPTPPPRVECITSLAFVLGGRGLAMSDVAGGARVWDAETGRELATLRGHADHIHALAISADGRRLATASSDRTARIWDAETGRELATLRGHTGEVHAVAFLPGGTRLISAGLDQTIRIWDIATGREFVSLAAEAEGGSGADLTVSADGRHFAIGGRVWVAVPSSPARLARREALGLAAFWAEHANSAADLRARIEADPTVTEEVRAIAHGEAAASWEAHVRERAEDAAFDVLWRTRSLLREDLVAAIRDDPGVAEVLRPEALRIAEAWQEPLDGMVGAAWALARRPDASDPEYRRAIRLAERAAEVDRESGLFPELPYPPFFRQGWPANPLGLALYRVGRYPEALDSLERSRAINTRNNRDMEPVGVAFLAMTQHRLGQGDAARKTLGELRARLEKEPPNSEFLPCLREAELLIDGHSSTLPDNVFVGPSPAGRQRP